MTGDFDSQFLLQTLLAPTLAEDIMIIPCLRVGTWIVIAKAGVICKEVVLFKVPFAN